MPDETLIQWGQFSSTLDVAANSYVEDTITFPISFYSYEYVPSIILQTGAPAQRQAGIKRRTSSALDLYLQNNHTNAWAKPSMYWIAVGRWK